MAPLIFFIAAAGTNIVAPNFGGLTARRQVRLGRDRIVTMTEDHALLARLFNSKLLLGIFPS